MFYAHQYRRTCHIVIAKSLAYCINISFNCVSIFNTFYHKLTLMCAHLESRKCITNFYLIELNYMGRIFTRSFNYKQLDYILNLLALLITKSIMAERVDNATWYTTQKKKIILPITNWNIGTLPKWLLKLDESVFNRLLKRMSKGLKNLNGHSLFLLSSSTGVRQRDVDEIFSFCLL